MVSSNVRLFDRKEKVICSDIRWHKDYVAISIPIKSDQRCSGLAILVTLPAPMVNLITTTS